MWSGSTVSPATVSFSPISPSPTSSSGCPRARTPSSPSPTPARVARQHCSTATSSVTACGRSGGPRCVRRSRADASSIRPRPTGSRRLRRGYGPCPIVRARHGEHAVADRRAHPAYQSRRDAHAVAAADHVQRLRRRPLRDGGLGRVPRHVGADGAAARCAPRIRWTDPTRCRRHHDLREPQRACRLSTAWDSTTNWKASRSSR